MSTPREAAARPRLAAARGKKTDPAAPSPRAAWQKSYYLANRAEKLAKASARYYAKTPYEQAVARFRLQARPRPPRKGSKRSLQPRYTAIALAYCDWSDVDEVVRIYLACGVMNELGWGVYSVDHIVPLTNALVCGLHVHCNLQVITHDENMRKGNFLWPGMPGINWATLDFLMGAP